MNEKSMNDAVTVRSGSGASLGRIDQYELKRELGGGGFGTVYLAQDTVSRVEVAVKGLPPFVKNNLEEMENIRANFNLVHALHHPHIAAALYLHPAKDVAYSSDDIRQKLRVLAGDTLLVMAYAPGVTLSQWRKQFPEKIVPLDKALEITRQVAEALDYAHGRKVVHRDVKPANVMIETDGEGKVTARVLDFGLAAEIRSSMGRVSNEIHDTSGTRPYMAPEQWLGGRQGPATDQYALAVLFHELVTGEVPFASVFQTGDPVVMMNVVENKAPEISSQLPRPIRLALAKALAKKVDGRFGSCTEFVLALEGKIKVKLDSREASPDGLSRRRPFLRPGGIAAVLALLGAAGIGTWHYRNLKLKAAEETQLFNMSVEAARACGPINSAAEAVRKFFAPEIGALMLNLGAGDEARKSSRTAIASNLYAKVLIAAPEVMTMISRYGGISEKLAALEIARNAADKAGAGEFSPELYRKARQAEAKADALLKARNFSEAESQLDLAAGCFGRLARDVAEDAKRKAAEEAARLKAVEDAKRAAEEAARQKEAAEMKRRAEIAAREKAEAQARQKRSAEPARTDLPKPAAVKPAAVNPAAVKPATPAVSRPAAPAAAEPVRAALPKPEAQTDAANGDEALAVQLKRVGFVLDARGNRHEPGTERTVKLGGGVSLTVSWCPPGWFMMGSPESEEGRKHDEVQHAVRLTKGFWIGKYEVTESQWGAVMGDGDSGEKPKCEVSWNCAQDFVKRLNARISGASFRLPTEAEWEYACRAGAMTPFSFGVGRDGGFLDGNQATCAGRDTYPSMRKTLFGGQNAWGRDAVGSNSFYANAWGINDMHGNVYEWCEDVFAPYPAGGGILTDPISVSGFSSSSRVIRGGCWNHAAKLCRSAFRTGKSETDRDQLTGFRVCCDDLP